MSNMICVEKAKPSAVKRLNFLPRIGLVVDFAGRRITYRQAPLLETLLNIRERGFSMKNFTKIAWQQLSEINLTKQPTIKKISALKKLPRTQKRAR